MQRRGGGKRRPLVQQAAKERIETLYAQAFAKARAGDLELARRYLVLAKRIGMRYTIRIPRHLKRQTCDSCFSPLLPNRTARYRNRSGRTIVTCLACGAIKRYPFKKRSVEHDEE